MPLGKDADAGDYVKDFQKSKAPQFKGKSKEKRQKMAIAAYLDAKDKKESKMKSFNDLRNEAANSAQQAAIAIAKKEKGEKPKEEQMTPAQRAKAMADFKKRGGKITKLAPGKAAGYHGKDDPSKGMHGVMDRGDTKAFGTRKKVRSLGASTEATNYKVQVTGPDHAGVHSVKAKSQDHAHKIVMKKIGQSKLPRHMQPKTRIMGESVDELSMYTSKKLPNLSYPKKKTKHEKEKDRLAMMRKNKQRGELDEAFKKGDKVTVNVAKSSDRELQKLSKKFGDTVSGVVIGQTGKIVMVKTDKGQINPFVKDVTKEEVELDEGMKYTHVAVDKKGLVIGFASDEKDAKDMARRNGGKVVKLKKPMSDKKGDMMVNRPFKESVKEEMNFAVSIEGLPQMFISADSPGMLKQTLRKIVKQPSMIQNVKRVTDAQVKKTFRLKAQGREEEQDESVNELSYKTMNQYAKKSKADTDRATNSAVATILRKGDHSKDLNTMRKREKGIKLAKSRITDKIRKGQKS